MLFLRPLGARSGALFLALVTLLLSAIWASRSMTAFADVSEALVIAEMRYYVTHQSAPPGGFMIVTDGDTAYVAQSGLQGTIAGQVAQRAVPHLQRLIAEPKVRYPDAWYLQGDPFGMVVIALKGGMLVLTALTFAFLALFVAESWSVAGGAVVALALANAPWLGGWATNLYWATPLLFAPFVLGWYAARAEREGRLRFGWFAAIIGIAIFAKALTGYEFLSCILSAAALPLVYYGVLDGRSTGSIVRRVVLTGVAGVVGFVVAMSIHLMQLVALRGSLGAAFAAVGNRVAARTLAAKMERGLPVSLLWEKYPSQELLALSWLRLPLWAFLLLVVLVALLMLRTALRGGVGANAWRAGGIALLYALLCSLSWPVLALNHMVSQYHLDLIVFFIPAALALFMVPAWMISARRAGNQP